MDNKIYNLVISTIEKGEELYNELVRPFHNPDKNRTEGKLWITIEVQWLKSFIDIETEMIDIDAMIESEISDVILWFNDRARKNCMSGKVQLLKFLRLFDNIFIAPDIANSEEDLYKEDEKISRIRSFCFENTKDINMHIMDYSYGEISHVKFSVSSVLEFTNTTFCVPTNEDNSDPVFELKTALVVEEIISPTGTKTYRMLCIFDLIDDKIKDGTKLFIGHRFKTINNGFTAISSPKMIGQLTMMMDFEENSSIFQKRNCRRIK